MNQEYIEALFEKSRVIAAAPSDSRRDEEFTSLVNQLMKRVGWESRFGRRFVENVLDAQVFGERNLFSEEDLLKVIAELDSYDSEWTVYLPVEGLKIKQSLALGNVVFRPVTRTLLLRLRKKGKERILATLNSEEHKKASIKRYFSDLEKYFTDGSCAEYIVVAEPVRATERAAFETNRALELLRLAIPWIAGRASDEFALQTQVGLQGDSISSTRYSLALSEKGMRRGKRRVGPFYTMSITQRERSEMKRIGIFELSEVLRKEAPTELETKLLDAVHWFASGTTQSDPRYHYLSVYFCLETLLGRHSYGGSIANTIAETTAWLLGNSYEARRCIKRRMKKLIKKRNDLVHGRGTDLDIKDLQYLEARAIDVIARLVSNRDEWSDLDDVLEFAEELKLS